MNSQSIFSGEQKKSTNNLGILCSSFSLGGLEINVVKLAAWMSQRGWNVILYVPKGSPMSALAVKYRVRINPISTGKKYFDIKGALNLCKQTREDNIKFLLLSSGKDISLCGWAKFFSLNRLRLIFLQQMMIGIKKKDIIHTLRYSNLDAWLSPLPYLAKELKEKTRIPGHKVHLVPLCIETERFSRVRLSKKESRRALNLSQDKTIIGIVGRLDFQKGQHTLIEAFSKLKENQQTELLIMGEETKGENNQYLTRLIKLAQDLHLSDKVHFLPFHNEVQIAYAAIDIFIMASPGETYGMVTIEAMASGLLVIGADAGGTSELLDHGQLGLLFKPGDAEDLAVKLKWALDHPKEIEKISQAGYRQVLKYYSHNRGCELIEAVIKSINN